MTTEQELKQWALNDYKEIRKLATQECALDRMIERLIEKVEQEIRKQVLEDVNKMINDFNKMIDDLQKLGSDRLKKIYYINVDKLKQSSKN